MRIFAFLIVMGLFPVLLFSQSTVITIQPGPEDGVDCMLHSMDIYGNYGDYEDYVANAWTVNSEPLLMRTLFRFELSDLPNETLGSATLHLRSNPDSYNYQLNSGENSSMLYMVTEPWYEYNASWYNQPSYRTDISVQTPQVFEEEGDLQNIDMTEMVQYWIDNPDENFGCMLMLEVEEMYACLVQSSSDHPDPQRRPMLVLEFNNCPNLDLDFALTHENKTVSVSYVSEEIDGICRWDFGDGVIETGDTVVHTYWSAGTYNIELEYLTDTCGIYTYSKQICICDMDADYEYYINYNQPNKIAFFPGEGVVSVLEWDFGDGSHSYEENPIHEFPGQGLYTVCLSCENQCNEIITVCYDVDIIMTNIDNYGRCVESIYPNPTSENVTIRFAKPVDANVKILTLTGKCVNQRSIFNERVVELNVANLDSGVYIIQISENDHQLLFEKLVVY